jgi:hypothetical protein
MDQRNIRRVKQILEGDYTSKSSISSGYEKEHIEHQEGEIWTENEKSYIMKNGIKRSYSKLSFIRHETRMPLTCPNCSNAMGMNRLDRIMWIKRHMCFDCVIKSDTLEIINGTFEKTSGEKIKQNQKSWFNDFSNYITEAVMNVDGKHFITEAGDIEDWESKISKEKLMEETNKQLTELKEKLEID